MSLMQTVGILVTRAAMFALGLVIAAFATIVTWKNIGFAWSQADDFGMGLIMVLGAVGLEIAKDWLPVVYYNQRHDAPRMATFVLIAFTVLLALSYFCSMWWENVDGTNRTSAVLLFIAHAFAAGGPVVWVNASKWLEERPTDGLPRAPVALQPAPMQYDALPAPAGGEAARTAFGDWLRARLSLIPTAQVAIGMAFANYAGWAAANAQMQISPRDFESLMNEAVGEAGGSVSEGIYTGLFFADQDHHQLTAA